MPDPTFGLGGFMTVAALGAFVPKTSERYAYCVELDRAFYWAPSATDTIDSVEVVGSANATGRWKAMRASDAGADLTNADATIYVSGGRWRTLPASTLTGNHSLTLGATGAVRGNEFEITRLDATAFTYAIVNGGPGAGTLLTMPISQRSHALFEFNGTNWVVRNSNAMI